MNSQQQSKPPSHIANTKNLKNQWQKSYNTRNTEIFLGDVEQYQYKYIQNSNFILVHNPSRVMKKGSNFAPKEFKVSVPLKQEDFYYQKVHPLQIIKWLNEELEEVSEVGEQNSCTLQIDSKQQNTFTQSFSTKLQPPTPKSLHSILINSIPICPNHSLFIPWINQKLPQQINQQSIRLVIKLLHLYDDLMIGYNSIGASASINNLHFHMFFKQKWIGENHIPITRYYFDQSHGVVKNVIYEQTEIKVQKYQSKFMNCILINIKPSSTQQNTPQTSSQKIFLVIKNLLLSNIPHNILFMKTSSSSVQIYIILRKFDNDEIRFACMQYSGVFCMDYEETTKQLIQQQFVMKKVDDGDFEKVVKELEDNFGRYCKEQKK